MRLVGLLAFFGLAVTLTEHSQTRHEGYVRTRRRVLVPLGNRDPITGVNRPSNFFLPSEIWAMRRQNLPPNRYTQSPATKRAIEQRREPLPPAPTTKATPTVHIVGPPAIKPPKGVAKQLNAAREDDFLRLAAFLLKRRFF